MQCQTLGFRNHFASLVEEYGRVVVVNLINATGEEGALASVFSRDVTLLHNPNVRYFHFDFHDYCRNNRYDQVSVMYSMLRDEHKQMGFVLSPLLSRPLPFV